MRHSPDFRHILFWSDRLANIVDESGYRPDIVIGIANKGLVPGKVIADKLNVPLLSIAISRGSDHIISNEEDIDDKYKKLPQAPVIPDWRFGQMTSLLIVDESINTGGSVIAAARLLSSLGASESLMRIAAIADIQVPKIADFWLMNADSKWYGGHFCSEHVDREYLAWMKEHFPRVDVVLKTKI